MMFRFIAALIVITLVWFGLDLAAWFGIESFYKTMGIRPIFRDSTEMLRRGDVSLIDHAVGVLIVSSVFVAIYQFLIQPKKIGYSVTYGLLFGVVAKINSGAMAYTVNPFFDLAMFISIAVAAAQGAIGGLALAWLIKK
ncbi:MAG: hypothetical protein KUG72_04200 [Pseudomonadales bacterium]|nr:hypothetical protein [Pseudomonadales bacterium]